MPVKRTSTSTYMMKICLLTIAQLVLLSTVVAQCPKGSTKEKICISCAQVPNANHFSDSCCSQESSYDFCTNCLKNLLPCVRELSNILARRAPVMKQDSDLSLSDTKKRMIADNGIQPSLRKSFYHSIFPKRVPEILVPAPPVDEQKRQSSK